MTRADVERSRVLRALLALGLVELVACGGVTALQADAGDDGRAPETMETNAAGTDAGDVADRLTPSPDVAGDTGALEAAAGPDALEAPGAELAPEAPLAPPDAAALEAAAEAPPSGLPACSAPGLVSYTKRCKVYPSSQCFQGCVSSKSRLEPQETGVPVCETDGNPQYNGNAICVATCEACPP